MTSEAPPRDRRCLPYDPWRDLSKNWPEAEVVTRPLRGRLLGQLRYPTIVLRAGTSAAQRRCTLTHEIIHLERGVADCGPWAAREELLVDIEVCSRLLPLDLLALAIKDAGGTHNLPELAQAADVDLDILRLRLRRVTATERARIWTEGVRELWSVA